MKQRYKQIDYLRGIAMCLVILCHSVIVYPINLLEDYKWYLLHEFTRYMCMPMFLQYPAFALDTKVIMESILGKKYIGLSFRILRLDWWI